MAFSPRLVFITAPTIEEARRLAKVILEQRLGACVSIVPGLESHYWWEGKLDRAAEVLLLVKSSAEQFDALRDLVALNHSYACPEIIGVEPRDVAPIYRVWWEENLKTGD
jgi:periplasmic divalent cation tolerance protein